MFKLSFFFFFKSLFNLKFNWIYFEVRQNFASKHTSSKLQFLKFFHLFRVNIQLEFLIFLKFGRIFQFLEALGNSEISKFVLKKF